MLVQYNRKMNAGDLVLAASGAFGVNSVQGGSYSKIAGIAGSLSIPFHKYAKLSGEVQYGQDLGLFLSYANAASNQWGARDLAVWGQVQSQWCDKLDTAFGYAIDNTGSSKVAAGNVQRNQIVFANFRYFPVKPFYFGIEYNYMRTTYKDNGSSPANIIFSNLVYNF
jgi:hypothetical protein